MQSKATTVDQYLKEIPENRKQALSQLREIFLSELKGYTEEMNYGMPVYSLNEVVEAGFASQKNYISIYILKEQVVNDFRARLVGANIGKGCIRYSNPNRIDWEVIRGLIRASNESSDPPSC